jgi:hypothetical protein
MWMIPYEPGDQLLIEPIGGAVGLEGTEGLQTLCWREVDSNHRSRGKRDAVLGHLVGHVVVGLGSVVTASCRAHRIASAREDESWRS